MSTRWNANVIRLEIQHNSLEPIVWHIFQLFGIAHEDVMSHLIGNQNQPICSNNEQVLRKLLGKRQAKKRRRNVDSKRRDWMGNTVEQSMKMCIRWTFINNNWKWLYEAADWLAVAVAHADNAEEKWELAVETATALMETKVIFLWWHNMHTNERRKMISLIGCMLDVS